MSRYTGLTGSSYRAATNRREHQMASSKRKPVTGLATGVTGRWTAKGTISLQIFDPHAWDEGRQKKGKRVNARSIIPTEPASYADLNAAREASHRLAAKVRERVDRGMTIGEFYDEWTWDHWMWKSGKKRERTEQTMDSYRDRVLPFVEMYRERPAASITEDDARYYLRLAGKGGQWRVSALRAFFTDMTRFAARLRTDNPFEEIDGEIGKAQRTKRKEEWKDAPEVEEVERVLATAREHAPFSLYAWLLTGTETGMRSGELDYMLIADLDLDAMTYYVRWQFNDKLQRKTPPKYNSHRTIALPPVLEPVLRRCVSEANSEGVGSPFVFNTRQGRLRHYTVDSRKHYWGKSAEDDGQGLRLRDLLADPTTTMYETTRHYFTTRAVREGAAVPILAKHLGHSDTGETLMKYYNRLKDRHAQDAMASFFAARTPSNVVPIRRAA